MSDYIMHAHYKMYASIEIVFAMLNIMYWMVLFLLFVDLDFFYSVLYNHIIWFPGIVRFFSTNY